MEPIGDIAGELPAPRNDEPESLRADIIDELTDHLQCAFHRELHTQASGGRKATDSDPESAARQRALARFGNPAAIARRLWYDAMKERIMSQRLTMASAIVMACACMGMLAVVMRMRNDADAAALERERIEAMLLDTQLSNHELADRSVEAAAAEENMRQQVNTLTERLDALQQTAAAETSDWNPVEFRLVQGSHDGPPAVGFSVQMRITTPETGIRSNTAESDETGVVRFQRVRYGTYEVTMSSPWNEYMDRVITLAPGDEYAETIICPAAAPVPLEMQLGVEWPEDLAELPIFMRVQPWITYRELGGDAWSLSRAAVDRRHRNHYDHQSVFVSPSGSIHADPHRVRFRFNAPIFVATDNDPLVRTIHWPGTDYAVPDVSFFVPMAREDVLRNSPGESMPENTSLLLVEDAVIKRAELRWRVEEGTLTRIVYLPPPEVVTAVREHFAGSDDRDEKITAFNLLNTSAHLPAPLMRTDLANAEP